ncbi:hypothetical protein HK096_003325, partial [Nowakowskiella sp. JEL0078]
MSDTRSSPLQKSISETRSSPLQKSISETRSSPLQKSMTGYFDFARKLSAVSLGDSIIARLPTETLPRASPFDSSSHDFQKFLSVMTKWELKLGPLKLNAISLEDRERSWKSFWCNLGTSRTLMECRLYKTILCRRLQVNHYISSPKFKDCRKCQFFDCSCCDETLEHHLFDCPVAQSLWRCVRLVLCGVLDIERKENENTESKFGPVTLRDVEILPVLPKEKQHALIVIHSVAIWTLWSSRADSFNIPEIPLIESPLAYDSNELGSPASLYMKSRSNSAVSILSDSTTLVSVGGSDSKLTWKSFCERLRSRILIEYSSLNPHTPFTLMVHRPSLRIETSPLSSPSPLSATSPGTSRLPVPKKRPGTLVLGGGHVSEFERRWYSSETDFCFIKDDGGLEFPWMDR